MQKIILYWFSGTGNTLIAAKAFADEMEKGGVSVELKQMPCEIPETIDADALAFFFPVYLHICPPFLIEWIKKLPNSNNYTPPIPVIVVDTLAAMSGLIKAPLYSLFKNKGYKPTAVLELIMPPNYFKGKPETKVEKIIEKANNKIRQFARDILDDRAHWPWRPAILNLLQPMHISFFNWFSGKIAGASFHANSNCVKCGLCVKLCPVGNITMAEGEAPVWGKECQQCMRCIYYCPEKAVHAKKYLEKICYSSMYRAKGIKPSELINSP